MDLLLPSYKHSGFTFLLLPWLQVDTFVNEDVESLRKTVQDLLVQLQEAERQHQSERVDFEVRFGIRGEGALRVGPLFAGASEVFLEAWGPSHLLCPFLDISSFCFPRLAIKLQFDGQLLSLCSAGDERWHWYGRAGNSEVLSVRATVRTAVL